MRIKSNPPAIIEVLRHCKVHHNRVRYAIACCFIDRLNGRITSGLCVIGRPGDDVLLGILILILIHSVESVIRGSLACRGVDVIVGQGLRGVVGGVVCRGVGIAGGVWRGVIVRIFGIGVCALASALIRFGLIALLNVTARLIVIICLTVVVRLTVVVHLNGLLHLRGAIKGLGINGQGQGGEQGHGGQEGRQAAAQGTVGGAVLIHLLPSFLFLSVALCL